jgi:tetratricopeptide (TPR) repeat protein
MRKAVFTIFLALVALAALATAAYNFPPIHDRLFWRIDSLRAQIAYALNPPEKIVFVPQDQVAAIVNATMQALTPKPSATPTVTATGTEVQTGTPDPTGTPTPTPTPLPASVDLKGIVHEYQKWNNCGPANLAMDLSFWGWKGDQRDTAAYLKPNQRDKNVMPYEMVDYVLQKTDFKAIDRQGGDLELLKSFLAAGFPVIVEKGFEVSGEGWMGHYEVVNGYDDAQGYFLAQDSYSQAEGSAFLPVKYQDMTNNWRAFNYTYVVVYPADREAEVMAILGPQADEKYNYQYALDKASNEIYTLTGRDQFFAWYNRGTDLVGLQDYSGAAAAYDEAFKIYPTIPDKQRPWRMLWYQTGPYFAYYYTGRYLDVETLATNTLIQASEPAIEETWVWRARARAALGDTAGAIDDLRNALKWHEGFQPALDELSALGANN